MSESLRTRLLFTRPETQQYYCSFEEYGASYDDGDSFEKFEEAAACRVIL